MASERVQFATRIHDLAHFVLRTAIFFRLAAILSLDWDAVGLIALMSCGAIGEPRPVQASQPLAAWKLPLLP